jgi:hypothetical protein
MRLYKSYVFRNKDPAIDSLRTIIQDETGDKQLKTSTLKQIEEDGGPTVGCMQGWFRGKTKRPQSASLEAAGRAVGYKRGWIRMKL